MSTITANVRDDPVWHCDTDYGTDIRKQKQYSRNDGQLVHFCVSRKNR